MDKLFTKMSFCLIPKLESKLSIFDIAVDKFYCKKLVAKNKRESVSSVNYFQTTCTLQTTSYVPVPCNSFQSNVIYSPRDLINHEPYDWHITSWVLSRTHSRRKYSSNKLRHAELAGKITIVLSFSKVSSTPQCS